MSGVINGQTLNNIYYEIPVYDSSGNGGTLFFSMPVESVTETDTGFNINWHIELSTNLSYLGNGLKLQPYFMLEYGGVSFAETHLMRLGTINSPIYNLYNDHTFFVPKQDSEQAMRIGCLLTGIWAVGENGNIWGEIGPYGSGAFNHYPFFQTRPYNPDPPYTSPDGCWLNYDAKSNDIAFPSLSQGKIYYYQSNGVPIKGQAYWYNSSGVPQKAKAVYYYDSSGVPHKCK